MQAKNLFSVIFLFTGMLCFAQDSVFLAGASHSFRISFDPAVSSSSAISNAILRTIADSKVKYLRNTAFDLNYGVEINVTYKNSNPAFEIIFHRNGTNGDDSYRGFSMSETLFPDSLSGTVGIFARGDGILYQCPFRVSKDTLGSQIIRITGHFPSFDPASDSLDFAGISPVYSNNSFRDFLAKVSAVNDYYACSFVTDTLLAMSESMGPPATVEMTCFFLFLEETGRFLRIADERKLGQFVITEGNDPENLKVKSRELDRYFKSASMTFLERLADLASNPDIKLPRESSDELISMLLRYIRWSFQVSERNSTVYQEFLDRFWTTGSFENDSLIIRKLASAYFLGSNQDSVLRDISLAILAAYDRESALLTASGQHSEALSLLNNKELFSINDPWMGKGMEDKGERIAALTGIYHSYLAVASSALSYNKPELAAVYLEKAVKFRSENMLPPETDSVYRTIYEQYIGLRLRECDTLEARYRTAEAMECYQLLRRNIDSVSYPRTWSYISGKIGVIRFNLAYESGMQHYARLDYTGAARSFYEAKNIAVNSGIKTDSVLDSLCRITLPWYLTDRIRSSESLIWNNRLEEAEQFADSAERSRGGLESYTDSVLNSAIIHYRVLISQKKCWNTEEAVSILKIRAGRSATLKNFTGLCSLLDSAKVLVESHPECGLRTDDIRDTLARYIDACRYQQMLQEAGNSVVLNLYDEALKMYTELSTWFTAHNIARFGLQDAHIMDVVKERGLPQFTLAACKYYMDRKQYPDALEYLKILRNQNYPSKESWTIQDELARNLAALVPVKDREMDPENLALKYTGEDKWFARFRSVFIRELKAEEKTGKE